MQLSLNIKVLFAVIVSVYDTDSTRLDLPLIEVRKIAQSQIVRSDCGKSSSWFIPHV